MKNKKRILFLLLLIIILPFTMLGGCSSVGNFFDNVGGGGESTGDVTDVDTSTIETDLKSAIQSVSTAITTEQTTTSAESYDGTNVTSITNAGNYLITGNLTSAVNISAENVHIYLNNATISTSSASAYAISSSENVTITLIGTNNITTTGKKTSAIYAQKNVTINGSGSLTINSTKSGIETLGKFFGIGCSVDITATNHGITADSIYLSSATININSCGKDGFHAESADSITSYSYSNGFIYSEGTTTITITNCLGDGFQADTFVYVKSGSYNISTTPTWQSATDSDGCYKLSSGVYTKVGSDQSSNYSNLYQLTDSCKGIKVGEIDYDIDDTTYTVNSDKYSILVEGGTFTINTTDDALHTNSGNVLIYGGSLSIYTSDDGIHADNNLTIGGGIIKVEKSYEGLEGKTVEISNGTIYVTSLDDGINGANSNLSTQEQKSVCHIIISGGTTYVNASGDGVDSNGGILISGGSVYVSGPTASDNAALDSENGIVITGGTIIAIGASGMVETPSTSSTQCSISINLTSSNTGNVTISSNGTTIASFSPNTIWETTKSYQSVVVSCPSFSKGSSYTITTGSASKSVTITSVVTTSGNSVGPRR